MLSMVSRIRLSGRIRHTDKAVDKARERQGRLESNARVASYRGASLGESIIRKIRFVIDTLCIMSR